MKKKIYSVGDIKSVEEQAIEELTQMEKDLCASDKLNLLFYETFGIFPSEVEFHMAICHYKNYLLYKKNQYVSYFIRVINQGIMLEIIAQ